MKPLIFEYAEVPIIEIKSTDNIEYSSILNLNVVKGTSQPAINHGSLDTETFTKANVDTAEHDDSHRVLIQRFLDTRLETRAIGEETESDEQNKNLVSLIDISNFADN